MIGRTHAPEPRPPLRPRTALGREGFTLVEALVALGLMGVILSALLPTFAHNLRINTESELRTDAVQVAQVELDRLRAMASWPGTGTTTSVTTELSTYETVLTHGLYCAGGTCFQGAREVTVEVRHRGRVLYRVTTVFTSLDGSGGGS